MNSLVVFAWSAPVGIGMILGSLVAMCWLERRMIGGPRGTTSKSRARAGARVGPSAPAEPPAPAEPEVLGDSRRAPAGSVEPVERPFAEQGPTVATRPGGLTAHHVLSRGRHARRRPRARPRYGAREPDPRRPSGARRRTRVARASAGARRGSTGQTRALAVSGVVAVAALACVAGQRYARPGSRAARSDRRT